MNRTEWFKFLEDHEYKWEDEEVLTAIQCLVESVKRRNFNDMDLLNDLMIDGFGGQRQYGQFLKTVREMERSLRGYLEGRR